MSGGLRGFGTAWVCVGLSAPALGFGAPGETPAPPDPAPVGAAESVRSVAREPDPTRAAAAMRARYERALLEKRLGPAESLSSARLREALFSAETKLADGRSGEVIDDLVYLIESSRFGPFKDSEEGRGARYYVGQALGQGGVTLLAIHYLAPLSSGSANDVWSRRALRTLVDLGLESQDPQPFLDALAPGSRGAPTELLGDVAYFRGRAYEKLGRREAAFAEYQRVGPTARFWAQATYLAGLIAVSRQQFRQAEGLFCKLADPKQTPRLAPAFGGTGFFQARDLARLGLGRIAHEQYRFDDARYYYFLVPRDSEQLPEALYETATTRYEAKDYDGARESIDELHALSRHHPYEDEALILDAYIDLAVCNFPRADASLRAFLRRYEPVRDAARRLIRDPVAMRRLAEAVERGGDPAAVGLGVASETARTLGGLVRVDLGYGQALRRGAELDYQLRGLLSAMHALDEASRALASTGELKAASGDRAGKQKASPTPASGAEALADEEARRVEAELAEVRRLLRETGGTASARARAPLEEQLRVLELRFDAERARSPGRRTESAPKDALAGLIANDRGRATELYAALEKLQGDVRREQVKLARAALVRLDLRLTRLLSRARLGRIETVLGKKRALEMEIEALSQGLLPHTIVDSLDAARYLRDDEEYWPFDGEDWEDEYVGGEGLE